MKPGVMLTVASLLTLLLIMCHLTSDVLLGWFTAILSARGLWLALRRRRAGLPLTDA